MFYTFTTSLIFLSCLKYFKIPIYLYNYPTCKKWIILELHIKMDWYMPKIVSGWVLVLVVKHKQEVELGILQNIYSFAIIFFSNINCSSAAWECIMYT